jgi:hypothetical protein
MTLNCKAGNTPLHLAAGANNNELQLTSPFTVRLLLGISRKIATAG